MAPKADTRAKIGRCCYETGMKRLTAIVALTLVPFAAAAQSTGVLATKRPITWGMIFALLFLMLGPIKLLGPFAAATKDCDRVFRLRLATRAFLFSAAAVTIAAALGEQMLENFAIPPVGVADRRGFDPFPRRPSGGHASIRRNPPARTHRAAHSGARFLPTRISDHRYSLRYRSGYHSHLPRSHDGNQTHGGRGCLFHSVPGLARYARRTYRCPLVQPAVAAPRRDPRGQPSSAWRTAYAWRSGRSDRARRLHRPGKMTPQNSLADIGTPSRGVRFVPKSRHMQRNK